jgi:hypothetical protein
MPRRNGSRACSAGRCGFLGIGTRKIAVEWSALRFELPGDRGVITVDVTRDQLRAAPEYKPSDSAVVRRVSD